MGSHYSINLKLMIGNKAAINKVNLNFYTSSAQKLQGKVTSVSMKKTVAVTVDRMVEHPIYKKRSKVSKTYLAHAEDGLCTLGDKVELRPCRPLSKRKRFLV